MSQTASTLPPLALTPEQEAIILSVLERNHAYYVDQGMSRPHMWPEELLSEIRNELTHSSKDQLKTKQTRFVYD